MNSEDAPSGSQGPLERGGSHAGSLPSPDEFLFPEALGPSAPEPSERIRSPFPRPLLLAVLFYIAGLTVGRVAHLPLALLAAPALGVAGVAAVGLLRDRERHRAPRRSGWLLFVALGLLGWAASNEALRAENRAEAQARMLEAHPLLRVEGRVRSVERWAGDGLRIRMARPQIQAAGSADAPMKLALDAELLYWGKSPANSSPAIEPDDPRLAETLRRLPGAQIACWTRSEPRDVAAHPWDFDAVDYDRNRGVGMALGLPDLELIEVRQPASPGRRLMNAATVALHESIRGALDRTVSGAGAEIARATLLGERSALSPGARAAFRDSGLAHILVVSGLHTGFVLALALFLARALGLPPAAWTLCGLIALAGFTTLVGFRPPVVRASIMGAFLLGAWGLGRWASTLAGLAASAFVTLLLDPRNLMRADWQLSYACVLSLTLLGPPLHEMARTLLRLGDPDDPEPGRERQLKFLFHRWLSLPVASVLAILMGLAPFQAHYFGEINVGGIVSNLIAIPLVFATMLATAALAPLQAVPGLDAAAGFVIESTTGALRAWAGLFAESAWSRFRVSSTPPILLMGYTLLLITGPHLRRVEPGAIGGLTRNQQRHLASRVGLFLVLLAWAPLLARATSTGVLELYVLDVGQGDGLVLRTPEGAVAVIDGGGGSGGGEGERTLVPFLEGMGVRRLAFVAATHADADHVGGLDAVIESFDVPLLLTGPHRGTSEAWDELMQSVERRRVRMREVRAGDSLEGLRDVGIRFLNPSPGQTGNDASLVMLVSYGEVDILLTGDIEQGAEYRILNEGMASDVEVLKVAHHGSATSTTEALLHAFTPELALISAGRNNRFGHPSPGVISRLDRFGIAIARTDLHGTLRLQTDGQRIRLDHYDSASDAGPRPR